MRLNLLAAIFTLTALGTAHAQMKDMPMKGMDMKKDTQGTVHKATGVVTKVEKDKVTIRHEPVPSLNWPSMSMTFGVKDKAMLDKVAKDKKVAFEFVQQGKQYVITSIK